MKLVSIEISGSGPKSWSSGRLVFGERVTQLFAKNGSGKTPIVRSIVFALGYKVDYADEILERCDEVTLEIEAKGARLLLRRAMRGRFSAIVEDASGQQTSFISERDYSHFLLSLWGMENPIVTTVGNESSHLYSQQILPLFYLDQSHGYSNEYYSASKFIKNQYAEVMRLVFGLGPKHPFDKRRETNELNEKLDQLDRAIIRTERLIQELAADLNSPRRPEGEIESELQIALRRLEELRDSSGASEVVNTELNSRLSELRRREQHLSRERAELEARIRGFMQIRNEIEVEANTLSLNEEARRVFASFEAICMNESCGLFARSAESYGKSLLYLRDQIKDLERTNSSHERRVKEISIEQERLRSQLDALRSERDVVSTGPDVSSVVEATSKLTERIIDLKRSMQLERELTGLESDYVALLEQRSWTQSRISGMEGGERTKDLLLLQVRNSISERIKFWLDVLRTPNVSRDVHIDNDFGVTFGGQKISKFTGSTLTRIVLAIRTASFDVATRDRKLIPQFFILDTPRQQDISRSDLENFVRELQNLASTRSAQIIYSTTNHRYELGEGDAEWVPTFLAEEHPMYLGPAVSGTTSNK